MITGFNTDVPYEGVTYHVQTEDKGLDSPLILSLVYVGGAIIASKRTPYEDLIGQGFDEQALTERLQRQHKLICAAIKSGRVEDLKRMSGVNGGAAGPETETQAAAAPKAAKEPSRQRKKKAAEPTPPAAEASTPAQGATETPSAASAEGATPVEAAASPAEAATTPPQAEAPTSQHAKAEAPKETAEPQAAKPETTEPQAAEPEAAPAAPKAPAGAKKAEPEIVILATLADEINALEDFTPRPATKSPAPPAPPTPPVEAPPAQASATRTVDPVGVYPVVTAEIFAAQQDTSEELYLTLLDDEGEFRAGQLATVKVYVGRGTYGQRPEATASVTVKVLGTSFRPLILTTETDELGVGVVRALLPRFTSGRAAIIIRAVAGDDAAEMRRIIHQ